MTAKLILILLRGQSWKREKTVTAVLCMTRFIMLGSQESVLPGHGTSFLSHLRDETREATLKRLDELIQALPAGINVVPGPTVAIVGNDIRIPQALLTQTALSDPQAAEDDYQRQMSALMAIAPMRKAAAANLILLTRTRRLQVAALSQSGVDAELAPAAWDSYWAEVEKICHGVTKKYIAAGGDPNRPTGLDVIQFESFELRAPGARRITAYQLIGPNGGGKGAFDGFHALPLDLRYIDMTP